MKQLATHFILLVLLSLSGTAFAGDALVSQLDAYIVSLDAAGQEQFRKADAAVPDEVIEYRVTHSNRTDQPLSNLIFVGPIPDAVEYIQGSAQADENYVLEVSVDGGEVWQNEPFTRSVDLPDGTQRIEIVPPSEYTHLRWVATKVLDAGSNLEMRYRVRVQGNSST